MQLSELAAGCDTSQKYLEQVLLPLAHAGILESKRGQHGGYRMGRDPSGITLAEVLRLLEGRLMPIPSWADEGEGDIPPLGQVLRRVRDAIRNVLENTTLDVLADGLLEEDQPDGRKRAQEAISTLMYYI
jgi:Rrf2 family protein